MAFMAKAPAALIWSVMNETGSGFMKKILIVLIVMWHFLSPGDAGAKDVEFDPASIGLATQADFDTFIAEFGTAIHFNPMAPSQDIGRYWI